MTPQEKASDLVKKFFADEGCISFAAAQRLATICVDEILNLGAIWFDVELVGKGNLDITEEDTVEFWQSVKQEIQKL